jgi:hypothetical protein
VTPEKQKQILESAAGLPAKFTLSIRRAIRKAGYEKTVAHMKTTAPYKNGDATTRRMLLEVVEAFNAEMRESN